MIGRVVVVGASAAGLRACEALRSAGFGGDLVLVGDESHRPYDRTRLSKDVLSGSASPGDLGLRKADAIAGLGLDLRLGDRAVGLDLDRRRVMVAGADPVDFDGLVVATGGRARRLRDQSDLAGVHTLRTLDDAVRLRDDLRPAGRHVVVIGGGFIGSEVASVARQVGGEVTIVETLDALLVRGLGRELGAMCGRLHDAAGVRVELGATVEGLVGDDQVEAVRLAGGTTLRADVVVVGIGMAPNVEWLTGSGLTIEDGLVCDAALRAGPAGVYAAGDVCRWQHPRYGNVRVEHWTSAEEQGALAARNLLAEADGGEPETCDSLPFVWSEMYGHRLQVIGRVGEHDRVELLVGDAEAGSFVAITTTDGQWSSIVGLDAGRPVMRLRRLMQGGGDREDAVRLAESF